jgi:hypothetical protein
MRNIRRQEYSWTMATQIVVCPLITRRSERSPMITSVHRFFQIAIWLPFIGLLIILLSDWIYQEYNISTEQVILIYWLGFGVLAYPSFAIWAARYIKKKSESAIVRLIWWAPVIFIPFYGVPWIAYGLFHVAMGETSGFAMAVLWVAFSPYIIMVGYVCVAVTFVVYHVFIKAANAGHEVVHMSPSSSLNRTGTAELFGRKFECDVFVSGKEDFALSTGGTGFGIPFGSTPLPKLERIT